jgi:CBS domain-containing protein
MKAKDIMRTDHLQVCSETTDCRHVAQIMAQHNIGSVPICDRAGKLEGIITDRDIVVRVVAAGKSFETPAKDVMSGDLQTCPPDCDLKDVEERMRKHQVRRLPVVDESGRLQGIISIGDLVACLHGKKEHELVTVLESVATPQEQPTRT